jgi:hypothetical protein
VDREREREREGERPRTTSSLSVEKKPCFFSIFGRENFLILIKEIGKMENLARERKSVRMLRRDEGKVHRERERERDGYGE